MTSQNQHFPSFATTISALGILLYCIGFLRVELELNNQKKRLNVLENNPETKPPSGDSNIVKIIKDARGMYIVSFLSYAAFIHSLKFNKYWNASYHPEKNILQDFTMINFAYVYPVFWSQFACDWLLLINERNVHERSFSSVCVLTAFQAC